jgi:hypothetical protein
MFFDGSKFFIEPAVYQQVIRAWAPDRERKGTPSGVIRPVLSSLRAFLDASEVTASWPEPRRLYAAEYDSHIRCISSKS